MKSAARQSQLVFRNSTNSKLGRITLVGHVSEGYEGRQKMRILGQYGIAYLLSGGGRYEDANGLNRRLVPGDMIQAFPHLPHRYGPEKGDRWTEFYLCFDGPVFELWESGGLLSPENPIYHLEPINHWLKRLENILGAPRKTGFSPSLLEVCRLQHFLAEAFLGIGAHSTHQQDMQWATRACAMLEANLEQKFDLHDVSDAMNINFETFRKRFVRLVGNPPAKYRMMRLIDRACELMQERRLSDREIAEYLGFADEFYFSRRFKQITGSSPRQFRQRFIPRAAKGGG